MSPQSRNCDVVCWGLVVYEDLWDWNLLYALTHASRVTGYRQLAHGAGRLLGWDLHTVQWRSDPPKLYQSYPV